MAIVHAGNNGNLRPPPPPPASAPGGCLRRDYQGTTTKMTSNKSNHLFPHCNNRACLMLQRQRKPFSLGRTRLRLVSGNNQRHRHAERTATTGTKCATCFMCGAQRWSCTFRVCISTHVEHECMLMHTLQKRDGTNTKTEIHLDTVLRTRPK